MSRKNLSENELSKKQIISSAVLKTIVIISAVTGTLISALAPSDDFMGGRYVFMYFTIQSNIALAAICLTGLVMMLKNRSFSDLWYVVKFAGTISITLTGAVFCFVLAPTMKDAFNLQNVLTHIVVPLASVIDFFVTGIQSRIKKINSLWVTVPPLLYAGYAGIGYINNWQFATGYNYPYFFLNWGSPAGAFGFTKDLPYMGTAWWMIFLLIALIIVGLIYLLVTDLLKRIFLRK